MAIIRPIGLPENNSERKAIAYLEKHLPDDYIALHNLELPNRNGLPYEYDMIVIGEYAVYTLEVKGYRGLIKGNAKEWELNSGAIYKSPIPLANQKARVLGGWIKNQHPRLHSVWVQALIVLSDDKVRIHLNDPQADKVLHLNETVEYILSPDRLHIASPTPISDYSKTVEEAIARQFRPLKRQNEIGDYKILDTIGQNNLYKSLLAENEFISQSRYTLKVYSFDIYATDEKQRKQQEQIRRDANALHRLQHPNIVSASPPFPWQDNQLVLPVEWVEGYSLRGLLDDDVDLPFTRKIDIIRQVGEGLQYAHSQGVLHRDVRPDNIIVPHHGSVKLVNFDCARIEDDDLQTIATRIGRHLDHRYVAPEMYQQASAASPASDQYALGAVLFEVLTGEPPCEHIREIFEMEGLPQSPTDLNPALSPDVDEVVGRMCAFKPTERYKDLTEVLEYLPLIQGETHA